MKILVMSCDKNSDLFYPFYHCMEKYWPNHPEILYCTETITNPYYKTIHKNYDINHWTARVREAISEIDSSHILLMCDDTFVRDYVDSNYIDSLQNYVVGNVANMNFQCNGDREATPITDKILKRSEYAGGKWKLCLMVCLWQKEPMLNLFDYDIDPWTFETNNYYKHYDYLIAKDHVFNWGRVSNKEWHWGVMQGKWCKECLNFLSKAGIEIDSTKRGLYD